MSPDPEHDESGHFTPSRNRGRRDGVLQRAIDASQHVLTKMHVRSLGRLVLTVGTLATVPGTIALSLWLLSLLVLGFDQRNGANDGTYIWPVSLFDGHTATVRSALSIISSSAIATLGTIYSITLVVFTLAAGNIGPRLLKRFTVDRTNQVTAGLLGGTFLFALTTLQSLDGQHVPAGAVALSNLLALVSVLQLIYFVHHVSRSVTIDEEIAAIAGDLRGLMERLVVADQDADGRNNEKLLRRPEGESTVLRAWRTGYITHVDEDALLAVALMCDVRVVLHRNTGAFVLEDEVLAEIYGPSKQAPGPGALAEFDGEVRGLIELAPSRTSTDDIVFCLRLLTEIALRALSPSINDTFTAVAVIYHLGAALLPAI